MPTPAPATAEGDVEEELDELSEAGEEAAAEAMENGDGGSGEGDAPEEPEVELADTNIGEEIDSPFDGVEGDEEAEPEPEPSASAGGGSFEPDEDSPFGGDLDEEEMLEDAAEGESIEEALNDGASRLATVGLPEEVEVRGETRSKSDLEDEFHEVFEAFQFGHYGNRVAQEYLFVDEEVDPVWGFVAATMACGAIILWMRPDGEDIANGAIEKAKDVTSGFGGSIL